MRGQQRSFGKLSLRTIGVANDGHMHEGGMLAWIDHPQFGRIVVANEYAAGEIILLRPERPPKEPNRQKSVAVSVEK
jgi:hypothetical protein